MDGESRKARNRLMAKVSKAQALDQKAGEIAMRAMLQADPSASITAVDCLKKQLLRTWNMAASYGADDSIMTLITEGAWSE